MHVLCYVPLHPKQLSAVKKLTFAEYKQYEDIAHRTIDHRSIDRRTAFTAPTNISSSRVLDETYCGNIAATSIKISLLL